MTPALVIYRHAMKSLPVAAAIAISVLALSADSGEPVDEAIVARIKTEAFQHSRVMDTLSELTDVYGARLRGSPGYAAAADWARQRLIAWGFEKVTFEPGGFPGPGWQVRRFNVEMIEPGYLHAIAQPLAWSPSTDGRVSGTPVLVEVASPADRPLLQRSSLPCADAGDYSLATGKESLAIS